MLKSMLEKMQMPKKADEEDGMLELEEGDMENEGEAPASSMDLSSIPDEELLAEAKKRGLLPEDGMPEMSMEE